MTVLDSFLDISASDLIGAYLQKEQFDHDSNLEALRQQAENQNRNLNAPSIDSPSVAVDTGYANAPAASKVSFLSQPWAIGGALFLAVSGLFLAVMK